MSEHLDSEIFFSLTWLKVTVGFLPSHGSCILARKTEEHLSADRSPPQAFAFGLSPHQATELSVTPLPELWETQCLSCGKHIYDQLHQLACHFLLKFNLA